MTDFAFTRGCFFGIAVTLATFSVLITCARAHTSKGGMDYDASCCGGNDCREIEDSKVGLELAPIPGGWLVIPTKEQFLTSDRKHVKVSLDGHYHRCSAQSGALTSTTFCLYIPQEV